MEIYNLYHSISLQNFLILNQERFKDFKKILSTGQPKNVMLRKALNNYHTAEGKIQYKVTIKSRKNNVRIKRYSRKIPWNPKGDATPLENNTSFLTCGNGGQMTVQA
jgi:hypothetical protein